MVNSIPTNNQFKSINRDKLYQQGGSDNLAKGDIVMLSKICAITHNSEGTPITPIEFMDANSGEKAKVISGVLNLKTNSNLLNKYPYYEVEILSGRRKGKKRVVSGKRLFKEVIN